MRLVKIAVLSVGMICGITAAASAACTAEDLQAKGLELSAAIQELAQKDPQKVQEISVKMNEAAQKYGNATEVNDEACAYYDELLALTNE